MTVSQPDPLWYFTEPPHQHVVAVLGAAFAALAVGTIVRLYALRGTDPADRLDPLGSLKCWWAIALAVTAALLLGRGGVVLLLVLISIQAWREYLKLTPAASADRTTLVLAQALILLNGWWLWRGRWDVFVLWLPLTAVLLPALSLALQGRTQGFVNTAAGLCLGLLLVAWFPAHAAAFYLLPADRLAPAGAAGMLLYLLLLTECNDIAQALVGRRFGRRHITPNVSPKKSLEGLLGGLLCTTLLAALLAPWLTPFAGGPALHTSGGTLTLPHLWSIASGLLISLGGFLGDITMSAIKRDAGVKDSGTLFPGQGGMLDRIDSLTVTAPLLAYFTRWFVL